MEESSGSLGRISSQLHAVTPSLVGKDYHERAVEAGDRLRMIHPKRACSIHEDYALQVWTVSVAEWTVEPMWSTPSLCITVVDRNSFRCGCSIMSMVVTGSWKEAAEWLENRLNSLLI